MADISEDNNTSGEATKTPKFCKNCGSKLNPEAKFCSSCGVSIIKEIAPEVKSAEIKPTENKPQQSVQNKAHQNAVGVVYFIGILNLGLGLVSIFTHSEILQQLGYGDLNLVYGLVFIVLGFFVQKKSYLALFLAIIIFILDSLWGLLLGLLAAVAQGAAGFILPSVFMSIAVRLGFLRMMTKGFGGIKALRQENQNRIYNRLNRNNFLVAGLILLTTSILINLYANWANYAIKFKNENPNLNPLDWFTLAITFLIPFFLISICRRRFHDLGQSGWRILLLLIPVVNLYFIWIMLTKMGNSEGNKYGKPQGSGIDLRAIFGITKPKLIITATLIAFIVLLKLVPVPGNIPNLIESTFNKIVPAPSRSINMGGYNGKKYTNNYFGISFTIPDNMSIVNNQVLSTGFNFNSAYFDDQPSKSLLQQLQNESSLTFAVASTKTYGTLNSANFSFDAEKISAFQHQSLDEHLSARKKQISAGYPGYTFSGDTKTTIDKVEFAMTKGQFNSATQDIYISERNGYLIYLVNTYGNATDKKTLDNIISSVKFTSPTNEGWTVDNFNSEMTLDKSGRMKVVETIAVDFNQLTKHVFSRDLQNVYTLSGKNTSSDISVTQVKLNNNNTKFQVSRGDKYLTVSVGNSTTPITGKNTYQIEYVVKGGILKSLSDKDELYWNVTGNNWSVPIKHTESTFTLPEDGITAIDCFAGLTGSTSYCSSTHQSPKTATFSYTGSPNTIGGMVVVIDIKKGLMPL